MKKIKVKDIDPIEQSPVTILKQKEFSNYVELPCLAACLYLYDLNIHTYSSGCNKAASDVAHIMMEYKYLDESNQAVAEELIRTGLATKSTYNGIDYLIIKIKTTKDDNVEEVSERLLNIVRKFNYQDVKYGFVSKQGFLKQQVEFTMRFKYENDEIIPVFPEDWTEEELDEMKNEVLFDANEAYEEAIDEGLVDFDEEIVWENKELFDKHLDYVLQTKGMKHK